MSIQSYLSLWELEPQLSPLGLHSPGSSRSSFDLGFPLVAGSAHGFLPDAAALHHGWVPGPGSGFQTPEFSDHVRGGPAAPQVGANNFFVHLGLVCSEHFMGCFIALKSAPSQQPAGNSFQTHPGF